jgi:poly(3-hydroxybutyrate) depolymerase
MNWTGGAWRPNVIGQPLRVDCRCFVRNRDLHCHPDPINGCLWFAFRRCKAAWRAAGLGASSGVQERRTPPLDKAEKELRRLAQKTPVDKAYKVPRLDSLFPRSYKGMNQKHSMKPTRLFGLALLLLLVCPSITAAEPGQTPQRFEREITRSLEADYLLFLPQGYRENSGKRWPAILFLHGAGERGNDLALLRKHGPPKIVENKPDFPFIVISPQCPPGEIWSNETLIHLLDHAMERHAIDPARVYLTGLSMGGFGTWALGAAFPERFAAMAPICGGGERIRVLLGGREKREALQSLAVWAFHGARDTVVPLEESERMVEAFKRAGSTRVKLTVYPEAGHDSWTETYDNPELYEWFLDHTRESELSR